MKNSRAIMKKNTNPASAAGEKPCLPDKPRKETFESTPSSSKLVEARSGRESMYSSTKPKPAGTLTNMASIASKMLSTPTHSNNMIHQMSTNSMSIKNSKKPFGEAATEREKKKPLGGLYYFDSTKAGMNLAEVVHLKQSEIVGGPGSKVVFWKKSRTFVLEDQQLFKVALPDFKKSRYGLDLSRIKLEGLENFGTAVVQSRLL